MFAKEIISSLSRKHVFNVLRPYILRCKSDHLPAYKEPHMNDIPVPHEPFEVGYKKRQVRNNFVLVGGILFFTASFAYVWSTGVLDLNPTPPKKNVGEKMNF